MEREESILLVSHDVEDHAWQFTGSTDGNLENARIIALQEAVELDPSVLELADLPAGWQAVRESQNTHGNARFARIDRWRPDR
jgi:hypothetical protein